MPASYIPSSCYEFQYAIDESIAARLRQRVQQHLVLDTHSRPELDNTYVCHSLYFDTPTLSLLNATVDGKKQRCELRIRFYDVDADAPVFCETKRYHDNTFSKNRVKTSRRTAERMVLEHVAKDNGAVDANGDGSKEDLRPFVEHLSNIQAKGVAFVSCQREAFAESDKHFLRISFDRAVTARPFQGTIDMPDEATIARPQLDSVLLNVTFGSRFPRWMRELVQEFYLRRTRLPRWIQVRSMRECATLRWLAGLALPGLF